MTDENIDADMEIDLADVETIDEMPDAPVSNTVTVKEQPSMNDDELLSRSAASAAEGAFTKLATNMALQRKMADKSGDIDPNVTLQDIVAGLLRPMLREWLDQNLPGIIEKTVQKELDKVARRISDGL